jgi:site-specific recombinase XerD
MPCCLSAARADADPAFVNRYGQRSTTRTVHAMVKRAAYPAGVSDEVNPHWPHALDNGATLAEVQRTRKAPQ